MLSAVRFRGRERLEQIAAGDPSAYFRQGDSGDDLRVVQVALLDRGFPVPSAELGQFGPETASAVIRFKTDESLQPNDAVIGMLTIRRLDFYFAREDSVRRAGTALFRIESTTATGAVWLTSSEEPPVWRANLGEVDDVAALFIEWLNARGYLPAP